MGFGELTEWVIGKTKLTNHKRNEKFGSNPFGRRRISIIPLFHHPIIPCMLNFRDVQLSGTGFTEYSTYWCFFKSFSCSSKVKPVCLAICFACNKEYADVNKSPTTTTMTSAYHFQKVHPRIPTRMIKANSMPPIMRAFFLAVSISFTAFFSFITSVLFRVYG